MYCKYCGEEISDNAKFCSKCGQKQEDRLVESPNMVITSAYGSGICILMSVLSFLSFFLPWIRMDERVTWYTGESLSYFGTIQLLRDWAEDEAIISIPVWLLIITAAILLIIHLSGVYAAIKHNENFSLYCGDSGAWSIVFAIIFVVTVFILDGHDGVFHYGWGMLVFLLLGAAQLAVCRYMHIKQVDAGSDSSSN